MSESMLNLWTDDTETYVADSAEQAREMQVKCLGENPDDLDEWHIRKEKGPLTIDLSEQDLGKVTLTHAEWIERNGPGFLCSSEY